MITEIKADITNKSDWNRVAPHPMQSWEWGEARSEMGIDVLRLGEYDGSLLKNIFQITFHKIPKTPFTIGYLPRSVLPNIEILKNITSFAKNRNCILIKIEPYVEKDKRSEILIEDLSKESNFVKSNESLFPDWTQQLDLTKSEEELFQNCKPKTRYNIRLAQKKGVTVSTDGKNDFEEFIDLYFQTCRRQKYHGHNRRYHEILFNNLRSGIVHTLVAYYDGNPLCAYEVFLFNDILYYPYGGSATMHRNVMAPNLLMWETILWGKKNGAKLFDMWGSLPPDGIDQNSDWVGFTRFKQGYGTKYIQFVGSYDLIVNPILYKPFNYLFGLRKKLF